MTLFASGVGLAPAPRLVLPVDLVRPTIRRRRRLDGNRFRVLRFPRWLTLGAVWLQAALAPAMRAEATKSPPRGVTIISDIPFATQRHERLVGDFFLPQKREGAPVALVIHGGGWMNSDKTSLSAVAQRLAEAGVAAFSINYRRITEAPWPACRDDCLDGFDHLATPSFLSEYGLAADRILVVGASAGGHLALMTGLSRPEKTGAIIAIAPPVRMEVGVKTCDAYLFSAAFFRQFFGKGTPTTPATLAAASPLGLVGPESPPLWLVHSRKDVLVPPLHSEAIAEAYRRQDRPVHLCWFEGDDTFHGLWKAVTPARVIGDNFGRAVDEAIAGALAEGK